MVVKSSSRPLLLFFADFFPSPPLTASGSQLQAFHVVSIFWSLAKSAPGRGPPNRVGVYQSGVRRR